MRDVSEPKNEVSLYALVAAKHAQASYDNTEQALGGLLGSVSLPGERDAYALCAEKYQEAGGTMGAVSDMAGRPVIRCSSTSSHHLGLRLHPALLHVGEGLDK